MTIPQAGPSSAPDILASTQVQNTPLTPSPSAISVSADGQLLVVTREEINIITPAFGIQVNKPPAAPTTSKEHNAENDVSKAARAKAKGKGRRTDQGAHDEPPSRTREPLFRNTVAIEKKKITHWELWANEPHAGMGATNMLEAHWRAATWSPTGLNSLGGCAVAAITNNGEALLLEPQKNAHMGPWHETYDLTSHILRIIFPEPETDVKPSSAVESAGQRRQVVVKLHECQATACAWSPAVPQALGDYSILVVGARSGHIALWRKAPGNGMDILHRYRMDDLAGSICLLAWSAWTVSEAADGRKQAHACLAVADAEGRVWCLEAFQIVAAPHPSFAQPVGSAIEEESLNDVWASAPLLLCEPDGSPATQFEWIQEENGPPRLAYTKLGTVSLVSFGSADNSQVGNYRVRHSSVIELNTEGDWMGASAYATCCGLEFLSDRKILLAALSDGSLHSIRVDPSLLLLANNSPFPSSADLTHQLRGLFERSSGSGRKSSAVMKRKEGARASGFVSFQSGGEVGWTYEFVQPDTLTYRPSGAMKSISMIAQLWHVEDQVHFDHLQTLMLEARSSRVKSPLARLRSVLHLANDRVSSESFLDKLMNCLDVGDGKQQRESQMLPLSNEVEVAAAFVRELFEDEALERLRIAETLSRLLERHDDLPADRHYAVLSTQTDLARRIAKEIATRLGTLLSKSQDLLGRQELAVSGRLSLASASLLPVDHNGVDSDLMPADALSSVFEGEEKCPACQAEIPFANIRNACCAQGHQWQRCSITLSVIASTHVRTCIGCERKALDKLAPKTDTSTSGADDGQNGVSDSVDIINAILKEATCCLYCGERWMRIR